MFYNIHNVYQRTPLHILNAAEIYEKCKSRELKSSFNESGSCLAYNTMKRYRSDLANMQLCLAKEKKEMWPFRVIFLHQVLL